MVYFYVAILLWTFFYGVKAIEKNDVKSASIQWGCFGANLIMLVHFLKGYM